MGQIAYAGVEFFTACIARMKTGDCIKMFDGTFHYVQYINTSGAYVVPLAAAVRIISGQAVNFTAGGRTISADSIVEIVDALSALGGNCDEYRRYVKMVAASRDGGMAKRKVNLATADGATFGEFDDSDIEAGTGNIVGATFATTKEDKDMAKKAAAAKAPKAAQKVAKVKVPKTVRNCACGCGGQTTSYFAPGHDARVHGWESKLADGRIEPKDTNPSWRAKAVLVQTKTGWKVTKPKFYLDA